MYFLIQQQKLILSVLMLREKIMWQCENPDNIPVDPLQTNSNSNNYRLMQNKANT